MKSMKRSIVAFFSMLFVLGLAVQADADMYDFSSMGFTDGQDLEGMTLGIATFTSETSNLKYFSDYGSGIAASSLGGTGDIYIQFATPVSALSFRGGDGGGDDDAFAVTLYEFGTDSLIGTWATPVFDGLNGPEWYTLNINASNVGRVVFDPGNSGALPGSKYDIGGLVITDIGFTPVPVPVPGAVLLGMLGLSVAGIKLRKSA